MTVISRIAEFSDDLTSIRRDLHENPELGMEEFRTAEIVAKLLREWGIETHTGIGKTGVVGVLKGNKPGRQIGLRADMDALPMEERTNLPFSSKNPGVMHACGHDAHTTMLLGAARYLAEKKDFSGTAVFIFQPAEEGLGGARAMLADNLFKGSPVMKFMECITGQQVNLVKFLLNLELPLLEQIFLIYMCELMDRMRQCLKFQKTQLLLLRL